MPEPTSKPAISRKKPPWPLKAAGIVILTLFGLGLIVGLAPVLGIHLLPSEAWLARARPFSIGFGVAFGLSLTALVWIGFRENGDLKSLKTWLVLPFALLMGYWLGTGLVINGPALVGSAGRTQVTHVFTVGAVPRSSDRRCPQAIQLRNLPFAADEICGVPDDLRGRLLPGMRVAVSGTGNAFGLRPARIGSFP